MKETEEVMRLKLEASLYAKKIVGESNSEVCKLLRKQIIDAYIEGYLSKHKI